MFYKNNYHLSLMELANICIGRIRVRPSIFEHAFSVQNARKQSSTWFLILIKNNINDVETPHKRIHIMIMFFACTFYY